MAKPEADNIEVNSTANPTNPTPSDDQIREGLYSAIHAEAQRTSHVVGAPALGGRIARKALVMLVAIFGLGGVAAILVGLRDGPLVIWLGGAFSVLIAYGIVKLVPESKTHYELVDLSLPKRCFSCGWVSVVQAGQGAMPCARCGRAAAEPIPTLRAELEWVGRVADAQERVGVEEVRARPTGLGRLVWGIARLPVLFILYTIFLPAMIGPAWRQLRGVLHWRAVARHLGGRVRGGESLAIEWLETYWPHDAPEAIPASAHGPGAASSAVALETEVHGAPVLMVANLERRDHYEHRWFQRTYRRVEWRRSVWIYVALRRTDRLRGDLDGYASWWKARFQVPLRTCRDGVWLHLDHWYVNHTATEVAATLSGLIDALVGLAVQAGRAPSPPRVDDPDQQRWSTERPAPPVNEYSPMGHAPPPGVGQR